MQDYNTPHVTSSHWKKYDCMFGEELNVNIDNIGIFSRTVVLTLIVSTHQNKSRSLTKLKHVMKMVHSSDAQYLFRDYIHCSDTSLGLRPLLRMYREGWFDFVLSLLPYVPVDKYKIRLPPVDSILWLQYMLIICTAEKLDQSTHDDIVRAVAKFIRLCDCVYYNNDLLRLQDYELLKQNVVLFYCIRSFYLCHKPA